MYAQGTSALFFPSFFSKSRFIFRERIRFFLINPFSFFGFLQYLKVVLLLLLSSLQFSFGLARQFDAYSEILNILRHSIIHSCWISCNFLLSIHYCGYFFLHIIPLPYIIIFLSSSFNQQIIGISINSYKLVYPSILINLFT